MGRIWRFEDDIDTDAIIPARYNITINPQELAKYVFCEAFPAFPKEVADGDIIVAGENFGCGSSREHAPIAIKAAGISAIIAKSYARIFYRNAMNIGLPVLETDSDMSMIQDGDSADFNLENGVLHLDRDNQTIKTHPLPDIMHQLLKAGGLTAFVKDNSIEALG